MKVLLINPNRYSHPPVPPIGLEHIAAALVRGGHDVRLLDLCFSTDPLREIDEAVRSFAPQIVGLTVRNIDSVLYHTNEFFLDNIRSLIDHIKTSFRLPVIIGGSGVSADPEGVRGFLGADYAVAGPAEDMISDLIGSIHGSDEKVFKRKYRYNVSCPRASRLIDYGRYFASGGVAGFQTHKGCGSSCIYCIEADAPVSFRPIDEVLDEIRYFVDLGFGRFHLCDSEFNEDAEYSVDFCSRLKSAGPSIDWAVYMKPANYNRRLFKLMAETGVSLITLTVDSWKKCPMYWDDIEKTVFSSKSNGIKIIIDFLTGFPYEEDEEVISCLDLFRRIGPDSVGVNTYIRLYRNLRITRIVTADETLRPFLKGSMDDQTFIRPVFFNRISDERLREMIGGDPLFRVEGHERTVNYLRASR